MNYLFRIFIVLTVWLSCLTAKAQFDAVLGNSGTKFTFFVNNDNMTCEIRDERHKIDDRRYAFVKNERKIKAFKHLKGTHTLTIPEKVEVNGREYTVTAIGRAAFAGYSNVDYIVLPRTVTRIGDYAFFRSSIRQIVIPASVNEVGKRIFGYCENLSSITTMMGGVRITKESYAESPQCQQIFKSREEYAQNNLLAQNVTNEDVPTPVVRKPKRVKSDVDSNLPVSNTTNDNLFVVVIANENYQSVANVDYAMHDGEVFKQYCQTVLGVPDHNISFLRNATLLNMKREVSQMKNIADAYEGQARFIFYYAGHGFPNDTGSESYLLPVDGSSTDIRQGYSTTELYQELGNLKSQNVVVFMDACFSGSQRGNGMLASARGVAMKARPCSPTGKTVVFSAASNDETANPYPDQGHGLFTYFLLKKLKESPNVTLGELNNYIRTEVRKYSNVRIRKAQNPDVKPSPKIEAVWESITLK